jgi:asparagine synthase (glutamine-hydrolysing)
LCGISGYTHRRGVFDPAVIQRSTAALIHRGPDQQAVYESRLISLGAVRLQIIDLEGGAQPFHSPDGDTVLIFNGEIYNYHELRAELVGKGHQFLSHSDTEVLLHAFLEWDKNCFRRLRGMFAAAIWSERERRLVLARDRVGIKPLYFHTTGSDLIFGSEIKALFAHPAVPRRLDAAALPHYLSLNYSPYPCTMLEGIDKLKPGHLLEWRNGEVTVERFAGFSFATKTNWTADSAEETLDGLMRDSIREHLASDVPVGIWLSGGIDSSALLHYAQQTSTRPLKTFSIRFHGRSFDETSYIHEVVDRYGTEHDELDLNPSSVGLSDAIEAMAHHADEPVADAGALPIWFLSKLTSKSVKVALSGEGADELFGGYVTYRADLLASRVRRVPKLLRRSLLQLLRYWPVSDDKISFEYKMKRFLEGSLLPADEAHVYWNGTFSHDQQKDLLAHTNGDTRRRLFEADLPCLKCEGYVRRYLAFDQRCYLVDDLLQKVDRMSMAHSIEVRPPYLDHRIIEFAATLPDELRIQGRTQKVILKRLMKGKLPASVLRRPKTGLDIPTHDWLRGPLRTLLLDTLSDCAIAECGLFRAGSAQRLIRDHMERRVNVGYHLWGLLTLFLWMKHWNIQSSGDVIVEAAAMEEVQSLA